MGSPAKTKLKRRASTYNALVFTGALSGPEAELLVDAMYGKPPKAYAPPKTDERNSKAAKAKRDKRKRRRNR